MGVFLLAETHPLEEGELVSLHIMPGETKNIIFTLREEPALFDTVVVRFFDENREQLFYFDGDSEEIYRVHGKPYLLGLTVPPADTILYENREKGAVQLEWTIGGMTRIAKAIKITCGDYIYKDNVEEEEGGVVL